MRRKRRRESKLSGRSRHRTLPSSHNHLCRQLCATRPATSVMTARNPLADYRLALAAAKTTWSTQSVHLFDSIEQSQAVPSAAPEFPVALRTFFRYRYPGDDDKRRDDDDER
ncbi:hypothetical protein BMF94_6260 [Rhodotorula taiwanensis]|uniref:Uncharacterized protein n=1 Tax=Rhodotorula taiwanensis TaxID=741276 RepID=A0A2S5B242_9BASI|nr:hypothetical protein BMF94_6260 [Rhodotorula taiwanensis]